MKIGIRTHDLATGSINDVLDKVKTYGFKNIQLVFKKAFFNGDKAILFSEENARIVGEELKKRNIQVAMLGAYFNPVHSNKTLVKENIDYFKLHLKYAHLLGCKYVGSETGSFNNDKWTYNPKNRTEEGYKETIQVFKDLVKFGEENNTIVLMEPAYGHVIYDVKCLKRAYEEINSDYLKITIDLYNLLYIGNYKNYKSIFEEALSVFNEKIKIIHLKDFYIENDKLIQCGLGEGLIDFSFIIETIKRYAPDSTLIFEGVTGDDIIPSKKLIESLIK